MIKDINLKGIFRGSLIYPIKIHWYRCEMIVKINLKRLYGHNPSNYNNINDISSFIAWLTWT